MVPIEEMLSDCSTSDAAMVVNYCSTWYGSIYELIILCTFILLFYLYLLISANISSLIL